ncbi:hypothetical protein BJ944DRAFT_266669 [Cunninghamella echinulata]|nr:hypothetical protein BJ944DRAFT_266669 [Cunninghamella echinulata]
MSPHLISNNNTEPYNNKCYCQQPNCQNSQQQPYYCTTSSPFQPTYHVFQPALSTYIQPLPQQQNGSLHPFQPFHPMQQQQQQQAQDQHTSLTPQMQHLNLQRMPSPQIPSSPFHQQRFSYNPSSSSSPSPLLNCNTSQVSQCSYMDVSQHYHHHYHQQQQHQQQQQQQLQRQSSTQSNKRRQSKRLESNKLRGLMNHFWKSGSKGSGGSNGINDSSKQHYNHPCSTVGSPMLTSNINKVTPYPYMSPQQQQRQRPFSMMCTPQQYPPIMNPMLHQHQHQQLHLHPQNQLHTSINPSLITSPPTSPANFNHPKSMVVDRPSSNLSTLPFNNNSSNISNCSGNSNNTLVSESPKLSSWLPGLFHFKQPKVCQLDCIAASEHEALQRVSYIVEKYMDGKIDERRDNGRTKRKGEFMMIQDNKGIVIRFKLEVYQLPETAMYMNSDEKGRSAFRLHFIQQQGDGMALTMGVQWIEKQLQSNDNHNPLLPSQDPSSLNNNNNNNNNNKRVSHFDNNPLGLYI